MTLGLVVQGCVAAMGTERRDVSLAQAAGTHSMNNCMVLRECYSATKADGIFMVPLGPAARDQHRE